MSVLSSMIILLYIIMSGGCLNQYIPDKKSTLPEVIEII